MSDQLTRMGARNVTKTMDRLADLFQSEFETLGIPEKIALDYAKRTDLLSDAVELTAVRNFPMREGAEDKKEVEKTPAAKNDPEVPQPTDESAGKTDESPKSDDQNKPESYYEGGKSKVAKPEWPVEPGKNETGDSVEPAPFGAGEPHWDANAIADDRGGPFLNEPDEPYMAGHFAQNWFHQLRDKQEAGVLPRVDKFAAARMAMAACLSDVTKVAMIGELKESEVRAYIKKLSDLDKMIAETRAEVEKVAGDLLARQDQLSNDQKKLLKELGDRLPETLKGQGEMVIEIRDVMLAYTKVRAEKTPKLGEMKSGVLERAEEQFGSAIRVALEDIWDAVVKENTGLKKATTNVKRYQITASAEGKTAGVMDWLQSVSEFFGSIWRALTRLFDMATSAIKGSRDNVVKTFDQLQKAYDVASKEARTASEDDALLRKMLAEEGMSTTAAEESDEESCEKGAECEKDGCKKASHGFNLHE